MDFGVVEEFKESKLSKIAPGNVEAINILKRLNKNVGREDILALALRITKFCGFELAI